MVVLWGLWNVTILFVYEERMNGSVRPEWKSLVIPEGDNVIENSSVRTYACMEVAFVNAQVRVNRC